MAITKQLVQLMGGDISVESELGKGSCFSIIIKMQIATRMLNEKEMLVEHAENGQIAVEMFSNSVPGYFDGILMDIRMPVMDGLDATRAIRGLPLQTELLYKTLSQLLKTNGENR